MKKYTLFPNMQRKSASEKMVHIFVSLLFMLVAASYLYILVFAIIAACKTHTEIVMNPFAFPKLWNWDNFLSVMQTFEVNGNNFVGMLGNSLWFSIGCTFLNQFCCISLAYAISKYKFPGSGWFYTFILIVMTLPIYGSGGAAYKLYYELGLIDNYAQILISYNGFTAGTLYYYAYFKNLSWTYAEAARIDGANDFQIYFRVMLPQAKPIFGALFLTNWVAAWNSYEGALLYLPNLPTLPVGIYQFNQAMIYNARMDLLFAACVIVMIPSLILFAVFNKTITTNVSIGGIKG